MKHFAAIVLFAVTLIACSDFFRRNVVESSAQSRAEEVVVPVPEKATLDPRACEFGALPADADVRQRFVWEMLTKNVCPKVSEFRYYLTLLRISADQVCAAPESNAAEADLAYFWQNTISSYQYLIGNPVGPLSADMKRLSMEIYAWPDYNRFALNTEIRKAWRDKDAYAMSDLTPSRKGLSAVELLVHNRDMILEPGLSGTLKPDEEAFNALDKLERKQARCAVLRAFLNDTAVHTEELYRAWSALEGQYPRQASARMRAGESQAVLNEVSDGLFYVEKFKDLKVGVPLGLSSRCLEPKCLDEVELRVSGTSTKALRANLEAFKTGFVGDGHPAFMDLLREVGRADIADLMTSKLQLMDTALSEIEQGPSFYDQVDAVDKAQCDSVTSPAPACRLFFATKEFAAILKSDFLSALNLQKPASENDND